MKTRQVVFYFEPPANLDLASLKAQLPDLESYNVADDDNAINSALLSDLHSPIKLVFFGGDIAKQHATSYHGTWIEDTPHAVPELLQLFGLG